MKNNKKIKIKTIGFYRFFHLFLKSKPSKVFLLFVKFGSQSRR